MYVALGLSAVAAVVAAILIGFGVFDHEKPSHRKTSPTRHAPARGGQSAAVPRATLSYQANGYTARYPASWHIVRDDVDKGTYRETKFVVAQGPDFVLIDHSPGAGGDPESSARQVHSDVERSQPGYHEISFGPSSIGGVPAWKWTFDATVHDHLERRTDYFFNLGNDGFAVLGGGRAGSVRSVAAQIARSIRLVGGSQATSTTGPHGALDFDAIGPVKIGASQDEARSAFGAPDSTRNVNFGTGPAPEEDWVWNVSDGQVVLKFSTAEDKLTGYSCTSTTLPSVGGFRVGDTFDSLQSRFGSTLHPSPVGGPATGSTDGSWVVEGPTANQSMTYTVTSGRISAIDAGYAAAGE